MSGLPYNSTEVYTAGWSVVTDSSGSILYVVMEDNIVKVIAPVENIRYLVQVCGANILLSEQV